MRILGAVLLSLFAYQASASGIGPCSQDKLNSGIIKEIDPAKRVDLLSATGDVVGAIEFAKELPAEEMKILILCGPNAGQYYIDANLSDWVADPNVNLPIGNIYNDEYEVSASAYTLINKPRELRLKIRLSVKFSGDPKYADWEPFTAQVFANFPGLPE